MTRLVDTQARERIRTALDRNMVVEAAAGTGKTTELVHRIVAVLADGRTTVEHIVAVTFTEKAAGELKLRLRSGLEDARRDAPAASRRRAHVEHALAHLEEARVNTIHGFCADLLRERPVEAAVDPQFQVMTEPQAQRLYAEAFDLWLQEQLAHPSEGVRRSLRRESSFRLDEDSPTARLRKAGWDLVNWRDFPAPWQRNPFAREAAIDSVVSELHTFADLTERCANTARDGFYRTTQQARQLSADIRTMEAARARDYDGLEAKLIKLGSDRDFGGLKGFGTQYGPGVPRQQVHAAHAALVTALQAFGRAADADLAALLQAALLDTVARYERLKQRAGRLDFLDLLLRTRNLIRDSKTVRAELQRRLTHIFVDEFQDTDPLQAEILLLLAADDPSVRAWQEVTPAPGKLFIVGDPKQSIYRFRRADVGMYREVKELLENRGALCVRLTTSFRAVPSLQNAVNAAFAPVMTGDAATLQANYVPLSQHRRDPADQPTLIALPVPEPYGKKHIAMGAIEASLPDAVGAFVQWLLRDSKWNVTERERPDERVPISERHICLLFRRFDSWGEDITRGYVRALEARGIAHLLVGGKSFHVREEVETMRAALSAIEWPDDELSVFATLHGSLFAIDDEALLAYRQQFRRLHPFRISEELPETLVPIAEALRLLQSLHRARNYRPVSDTIGLLLDATRAHAAFVLRPSGEQALANVLHIAELARAYEASGGISFRGFVEQLREDAAGGQAPEAPILEEGSDGVRIMTVHKAKGLEFPVVILADMTAKLTRAQASRYVDAQRGLCALRIGGWSPVDLMDHEAEEIARDEAEGVRIAYVAATRARDLLVVPAVGDAPFEKGWVSPLNTAIYPALTTRRRPAKAAGCPTFGKDSVLSRPGGEPAGSATVSPGLHLFGSEEAQYGLMWWDPAKLELGAEPSFGIRRQELIGKEADRKVVEADLKAYQDWRSQRNQAIERGSTPSLVVRTAKERAAALEGKALKVQLIELPRDQQRPAGPRYGSLVHSVLATVPLDADRARIEPVAQVQGRILGATPEEVASAIRVTETALAHPLMEHARRAADKGQCRREVPVTLREPDGSLVDGVVDLAFCEDDTWKVVDFKTDRELTKELALYRRQVDLYAAAIATATGKTAVPILMRV
jgi:ATP-dependent helicase/nuclease subunit A